MAHDDDRSAIIHELANSFAQRTDLDELIPFVVERLREMLPPGHRSNTGRSTANDRHKAAA